MRLRRIRECAGGLRRNRLLNTINFAMPNCPSCGSELRTMKQEGGLFFVCDQCGGRAATIPQIQRAIGGSLVTQLLHEINGASTVSSRKCPFCALPMRAFRNLETELILDACKACSVVWFDATEFEQAAERGKESGKVFGPRYVGGRIVEGSVSDDSVTVEALKSLARFLCLPF